MMTLRHITAAEVRYQQRERERERERYSVRDKIVNEKEKDRNSN